MATFGLPDKELLSVEVQKALPADYDGVSQNKMLVKIFEKFTPNHVISEKLRGIVAMSKSVEQFFGGLAETFPETGASPSDYWSINAQDDFETVLFWFSIYQSYGNILDNGKYLSISNTLRSYREAVGDGKAFLDEEVLRKSFDFTKFLRDEGAYTSVEASYFFLSHVDVEEALKLLASGITVEEYKNYCALECYTYADIFEGQVADIPEEWRDFLFGQLVEERSNNAEDF